MKKNPHIIRMADIPRVPEADPFLCAAYEDYMQECRDNDTYARPNEFYSYLKRRKDPELLRLYWIREKKHKEAGFR